MDDQIYILFSKGSSFEIHWLKKFSGWLQNFLKYIFLSISKDYTYCDSNCDSLFQYFNVFISWCISVTGDHPHYQGMGRSTTSTPGLCNHEILVRTKPSVRPPFYVSQGKISHFEHSRVLAVNRMVTRSFRERKQQQSRFFCFVFSA